MTTSYGINTLALPDCFPFNGHTPRLPNLSSFNPLKRFQKKTPQEEQPQASQALAPLDQKEEEPAIFKAAPEVKEPIMNQEKAISSSQIQNDKQEIEQRLTDLNQKSTTLKKTQDVNEFGAGLSVVGIIGTGSFCYAAKDSKPILVLGLIGLALSIWSLKIADQDVKKTEAAQKDVNDEIFSLSQQLDRLKKEQK